MGVVKLELRNISKAFPGVQALQDVSIQVESGSTHVICGENGAGKSTLVKIIHGVYQPDEGEILIDERPVRIADPRSARDHGIAMIYQELSYVPDLTLEENIFMGHLPSTKFGRVDWKTIRKRTIELLAQENLDYQPDVKLRNLSVSDIQMIEIIKSVSYGAQIIIMDEPTSAISSNEVEKLFRKIEELKAKGVSILYISHKMDEMMRIADTITILRDGRLISTMPVQETTVDGIIEQMVGRTIEEQYPPKVGRPGEKVFEVQNLASKELFADIGFTVCKGEIIGFAGLMGAGRTEVMRAVFGLDPYDAGKVMLNGKDVKGIRGCIDAGLVMLTEDRRRYGIIPVLGVQENVALAALDKYIRKGRWYQRQETDDVEAMCKRMNVKTPSLETKVRQLSGGNQQKVVLAKWMIKDPEVLILDEPTRGIDVGSKSEIYHLMIDLVRQGKSIILISSELPELVGLCDRVYVMKEGRISGMLEGDAITQENIMELAIKSA